MRNASKVTITAAVLLFTLAGWAMASQKNGGDEAGKGLFENNCGKCHTLDKVRTKKKNSGEWEATVNRMQKKGAAITDAEANLIAAHLSAAFKK